MATTPPQRKLSDDYFFRGENSQGGTYYVRIKYPANRSENFQKKSEREFRTKYPLLEKKLKT